MRNPTNRTWFAVLVPVRESPRLDAKMRADYDRFGEVRYYYVLEGPATIESAADVAASRAGVIAAANRAVQDGAACVVLACFSEPGADGLSELGVPVVGEGRSALAAVGALYEHFAIIGATSATSASKMQMAEDLGVADRLTGVFALDLPVNQLSPGAVQPYVDLIDEAASNGARAVILGCTGLEAGITESIRAALPTNLARNIAIVDPADVAGRMAMALAPVGASS